MVLTDTQSKMLEGEEGPFLATCMRWLVEWGEAMGALRLVPCTNTHALVTVPGNLVAGAGRETIDSAMERRQAHLASEGLGPVIGSQL